MLLIAFADIIIVQIQIGLLCYGYTGMTQQFASCVDIHTAHQTPLGEVVSQTVGRELLVQAGAD